MPEPMHIALLPTSTPPEAPPEQALLEANLAWLREELDGSRGPEQKAALRHEIGMLERLAGRDSSAVRELLAAANALPRFKEPLEQLIVLIERHRSFKNLPTLLEHLCRTADGAEEVARAQVASAWFSILHAKDDVRALEALDLALAAVPTDPAALITLEIVARRLGDADRSRRALTARCSAAVTPAWAGVLQLELADALASAGEYESANDLLKRASVTPGEIGFLALERRALLGRQARKLEWTREALESQVNRILVALEDPGSSVARDVPASQRARGHALHRLLQCSRLERERGADQAALALLARAFQIAPDEPSLVHGLLEHARFQPEALEALIERELATEPTPPEASALWVRLAECQIAQNDVSAALVALERARKAEPTCWVGRALELDLLRGTRDELRSTLAHEQIAMQLEDGVARSRYWLLAAHGWARQCRNPDAARHALAQALDAGAPALLIQRVERALAHSLGDSEWYSAAGRALLDGEPSAEERAGLALEAWRAAFLAGNLEEAARLTDSTERLPEGRFAARIQRGYLSAGEGQRHRPDALFALAALEGDALRATALHWVAALRVGREGAGLACRELLEQLHARYPANAVVAGTLTGLLLRDTERDPAVAEVLRATAAATDEGAFAASLYIEAGLRSWRAGHAEAAVRDFESAERLTPGSAAALAAWARRSSDGRFASADEPSSRDPAERLVAALERAAQTPAPTSRHLSDLVSGLRAFGDRDEEPLFTAARLLSLFLGRVLGTRTDPNLLERLAAHDADASRLVDTWRYLDGVTQVDPSPKTWEETTRRWAESSGGLPAALEWLGATQRLGHRGHEGEARRHLARLSSGPIALAWQSSAALVAHLTQTEAVPWLVGDSPELRLTNLETSPPGCDPRRRARALEGAEEFLGNDAAPMLGLLRGYNQLASGDGAAAAQSFRRYSEAFPDDPAGWEGLVAAARHGDDPVLLAEAAAALGRTSRDSTHAARLFEEAADIFFERLNDPLAGHIALTRAVALDVSRSSSFQRLFALACAGDDAKRVLELVENRLGAGVSAEEAHELEWERARAARRLDDTGTALSSIDKVLGARPDHYGALALLGEIYLSKQRYAEAADTLARLATLNDAPRDDRLTSGLCAVDLFENQLNDTRRALAVLLALHRAGLSTLAVRERLARSAAKAGAWDEAVIVLEQLMFERTTPDERAEAARLALAIHRDRRNDAPSAGHAAEALLDIIPDDAETLDLALTGVFDLQLTEKLLRIGRGALLERLSRDPLEVDRLRRLARIAERSRDVRLRQVTVGALTALGHSNPTARTELGNLDQRVVLSPHVAVGDDVLEQLRDPDDNGPVPQLFALVAPHLGRAIGPTLSTFQVGKRERLGASSAFPVRDEVAAWIGAFGLGHFELYRSTVVAERVAVVSSAPLAVIIGALVGAPLGAFQRQELVRALYAERRGLGALMQLDEADAAALVVASCRLGGVTLDEPQYARQADFERQLGRVLPRKVRKELPALAEQIQSVGRSLPTVVRGALGSLDRAAAVAVGDVSLVLLDLPLRRPGAGLPPAAAERLRRLLSFVLSAPFEQVRDAFGVSTR